MELFIAFLWAGRETDLPDNKCGCIPDAQIIKFYFFPAVTKPHCSASYTANYTHTHKQNRKKRSLRRVPDTKTVMCSRPVHSCALHRFVYDEAET